MLEVLTQETQSTKDKLGRTYSTGKRKNAIARVWVKPGHGKITVNTKESNEYFGRSSLRQVLVEPFTATKTSDTFDVMCTVKGGGLSGQASAIKHGISKALVLIDPELRGALRSSDLLTRDSRVVERKKFGRAKARKGFQFSKR